MRFESREGANTQRSVRRVVPYPDLYTNYVEVERGKATAEALEALGAHVVVPDVPSS